MLPELQKRNPPIYHGYRKYKHFQFLTPETGSPHLDKQIVAVTTLMRAAEDKRSFEHLFKRAFPKKNQQLDLPLPHKDMEDDQV